MTTKTDPGIIDAEVIDVTYDDDKPNTKAHTATTPKRGMAGQLQRHVQNLSPERKAALKTIAKRAGIVGMATYAASLLVPKVTDQFAGEGDHKWTCKAPERNRTSYYPVTGNGNYDDVSGVDKLDRLTADLNAKTFGYDPEDVRSFHNFSCVDGCVNTLTEPSKLSADVADKYLSDVHDAYSDTISDLNRAAEEPWVQALIQQRYSTLSDRQDEVQTISTAAGKMLGSTNNAAGEAHSLLRNTIRKTRADLAHGYAHGQSGFSWTATAAGAAAGLRGGLVGAGVGAVGAGLVSGLWGDHFPDDVAEALETRLDDAASKAKDALKDNDDDIELFNAVVSDFGGTRGEGVLDSTKSVLGGLWDKVTGILPDHIPGTDGDLNPLGNLGDITFSPLGTSPSTSPSTDSPSVTSPSAQTPSTPSVTSPVAQTPTSPLGNVPSMSSPLGDMGTPSMGTPSAATPTSSMTPQSFDQLMGNEPETEQPQLFDGTEVPTDDASSDSSGDTDKSDDSDVTDPETVDSTDKSEDDTKNDDSDGEPVNDAAAPVHDSPPQGAASDGGGAGIRGGLPRAGDAADVTRVRACQPFLHPPPRSAGEGDRPKGGGRGQRWCGRLPIVRRHAAGCS